MVAEAVAVGESATTDAKYNDARHRLTDELQKIADEVTFLDPDRPEWKPLLDSRRIVGTVLVLEDLFPVRLPPDQLVRKGGYNDVKEAVEDIIRRHKRLAAEKAESKTKPKRCAHEQRTREVAGPLRRGPEVAG